ncbi:hypothetical protein [Biostraticola tofi]|uniref:Uncharacterized protein n=1 Tax=Biostraticola tofi TaxID=466109 RepID=A0A4R3YHT1_9GAMM|nr:hypothetical protein [Biostraticola tofi]TCV91562.1 hypothetical protein EDC52_11623 [Biostraticola tofi]
MSELSAASVAGLRYRKAVFEHPKTADQAVSNGKVQYKLGLYQLAGSVYPQAKRPIATTLVPWARIDCAGDEGDLPDPSDGDQ